MPQPAGLQAAERVGPRLQQGADGDGFGAGRVGHHHGLDLQAHHEAYAVSWPNRLAVGIHLQQSRIGVLGGDQVEQAGDLARGNGEQPAADPDQRAHRFAQRQRRVVGHLQDGLHSAGAAARSARAGQWPSVGMVIANEPSASRWCTGVVVGSSPSTASIAPPARAQALRIRSAVVGAAIAVVI